MKEISDKSLLKCKDGKVIELKTKAYKGAMISDIG